MFVDRVEISFDAGHRVLGHAGKCGAPHGHTYRAEVFVASAELNALGFGIDFGDLKTPLKRWIDDHWDHAFLLNDRDTELVQALGSVARSKLYLLAGANPSAEGLARELFRVARERLRCPVSAVRIWESPTQYAELVGDGDLDGQTPLGRLAAGADVPTRSAP